MPSQRSVGVVKIGGQVLKFSVLHGAGTEDGEKK